MTSPTTPDGRPAAEAPGLLPPPPVAPATSAPAAPSTPTPVAPSGAAPSGPAPSGPAPSGTTASGTTVSGPAATTPAAAAPTAAGPTTRSGRSVRPYDEARVQRAVRELLSAVGEDPDREGLRETPARVARAYREVFAGLTMDPRDALTATFDVGHGEMVLVRDIEVYSTCEHHLVPFHGVAHVGYIPGADGRVTGLSKIARLVDVYARRPQVQERLTTQIADAMVEVLEPRGVIVVVECEHLCMSMRGVRKPGSRTTTSAVRGQMRDAATRAEAMSLVLGR
ncbi:GTP cyclohydrolase I [Cellulomonas sp. SLBN-39]|nr:GTP cyclohydrolase I [Cellulomonas sp. SLBN-39]